jgi:hypothetical protein
VGENQMHMAVGRVVIVEDPQKRKLSLQPLLKRGEGSLRNLPEIKRVTDILGFGVRAYNEFVKPRVSWSLVN